MSKGMKEFLRFLSERKTRYHLTPKYGKIRAYDTVGSYLCPLRDWNDGRYDYISASLKRGMRHSEIDAVIAAADNFKIARGYGEMRTKMLKAIGLEE